VETYALDFETYYDKHCSIKNLGPLGYFSHPDFEAYMVSVVGTDGTKFVGHPDGFDWHTLNGNIVISHNASFDETLYLYGNKEGWWPQTQPQAWYCSADLAAFCKLPRSLKGAAEESLGHIVSKSTRDRMSGKRWSKLKPERKEEVTKYALKDSELCLELWLKHNKQWPETERAISLLNRKIVQGGIPIDIVLLQKQLESIRATQFKVEQSIPWNGERPLLSRAAFNDECRKVDLEPPASLAASNEESQKWIDTHSVTYPWVGAVKNWRRINALKKKIESFDYATMPDNRYYGGIMYFGAHTGRFSGSGGNLNLQNLPRSEMFGVNLRHLIATEESNRLVVVDLSQIEVRTLCWLAGDGGMLEEIASVDDIYEAFAIRFKMWSEVAGPLKKNNPALRHKVKQMVLGCGYGAGKNRFREMSGMTQREADLSVNIYRNSMPTVTRLWAKYNSDIKGSLALKKPFTVTLPSGRVLDYGIIKRGDDFKETALLPRHGKKIPIKLWGGLIAENASQALARDIFSDMLLRVSSAGHNIVFHVHDEMVIEADAQDAEKVYKEVVEIMSQPPEWIDLPLAAEGAILTRYEK